jgi:hypothetical protein
VYGTIESDNQCVCDGDYKGNICDVRCVNGDIIDGKCVCKNGFTGPTCARDECPYGSLGSNVWFSIMIL